MDINSTLNIIRSYPFVDIDKGETIIRRHVATAELTPDLLRSYLEMHGQISIVPKRMNGNAPTRLAAESMTLNAAKFAGVGMGALDAIAPVQYNHHAPSNPAPSAGNSDVYRILYEQALADVREYKRKYEDAKEAQHKAELELAGNKNSMVGDIAQGLAGVAPMLFGGGGAPVAGLAGAPPATQPQAPTQPPRPVDQRTAAIVKHYSGLDDTNKQKVYTLLAKVFSDISRIDDILTKL